MRTDAELLAAYAASGDEPAFAELAARHGPMVHRVCVRALADHHRAEDAAQAVFVVLARKAGSLPREVNLAAWLHGTARNAAHWAGRQEARRARREEEAAMVRRAQAPAPGELPGRLDRELAALPAEQRQAVILRYLEGRTQEQAAAVAGCPQGTLVRRAMLGLERLRQRLFRQSPELGAALLLGLLQGEAEAAVPGTLLPSLLAASKLAATGAAAGAAGSTALAIAEGAMQAMFWMKVKIAAAVLAAAAVVGTGTPLVYKAVAGDGPTAEAKAEVIRAKVVKVEVGEKLPPVARVTISAGKAQGVRKGFVFQVLRDDKPLNPPPNARELTIETVGEAESVGSYPLASGVKIETPRVGDLATTRLTEIAAGKPAAPAAVPLAGAEAVNGLRLVLSSSRGQSKPAEGWGPGEGGGLMCPKCRGKEADGWPRKCEECKQDIKGRTWGKYCNPCAQDLARCAGCGLDMPGATVSYKLRWENAGKEPLVLTRDRCCDLYDHVFLKGPDGKLAPARQDNRARKQHAQAQLVSTESGKSDWEAFDPWFWVVKPAEPGEYTLWVEFAQKLPQNLNGMPGKGYWTGQVRSNEVKVQVTAGAAKPATPEVF